MPEAASGVNNAVAQAAFNEKKWVWVEDNEEGFVKGYITSEDKYGEVVEVFLDNGQTRTVTSNEVQKVNPPKFDGVDDMADLTFLNEASVVHNLRLRYHSNLIYTYSGLFLVAVNPYRNLNIYTNAVIEQYRNRKRGEAPPHIYAVADQAYHDMLQDHENQSILITGESGAGKTENTKKVIQYLASVASDRKSRGELEEQILQANPILEAFGNAQTIRNNNSSRFGKFIRIEFNAAGRIAGGNIEWYLLEKSRVAYQSQHERSYHVFYQLVNGGDVELQRELLLDGTTLDDYGFTKKSNKYIDGVDDAADYRELRNAMTTMRFSSKEQHDLFRIVAAVLHLGNLTVVADRDDQARLPDTSVAERICHLLGIPVADFERALLRPRIKAGRDWVPQARNREQVLYSVEALAKTLYERSFGKLVERINTTINRRRGASGGFIGVLDIAGFEIFEVNSFEQLCINYTNEKLQQFFNHRMFNLEQEEYRRENIEWKQIDFGLDLQPTIDLIEKTNPVGILSCLEEECFMPKATDKTFIDKLNSLWRDRSEKYEPLRFKEGFVLQHYAAKVEYATTGWLNKNKDPLNESVARLFAYSSEKYVASLFQDYLGDDDAADPVATKSAIVTAVKTRVMRKGGGFFRTVGQRHKEQLHSLMEQLKSTQPHFVRCIVPNAEKRAGKIDVPLVLDQLRCNGVVEGIRICRAGFPNRLPFAEFKQRYEILTPGVIPQGFMDGRKAALTMLQALQMDENKYRVGSSKVFFRATVLAELEEIRDQQLSSIFTSFQAACRTHLARKNTRRRILQLQAIKVIQRNARVYVTLREWPWWRLYAKIKPLTNVTRVDLELKKKEESILELKGLHAREAEERQRLENERRELEDEKHAIEEQLRLEQQLAQDHEAILIRTQKREADLEEELNEVTAELEEAERQCEELIKTKKMMELQNQELEDDWKESMATVARLEEERAAKDDLIHRLEQQRQEEVTELRNIGTDRKAMEAQVMELQQTLEERQAELEKMRIRLQIQVRSLEDQLTKESGERAAVKRRYETLETDYKQVRDKLTELTRMSGDFEGIIRRKEADVAGLTAQLKEANKMRESSEREKKELQNKISAANDELKRGMSEREKMVRHRQKLEGEMEELKKLMEAKGDKESKEGELRRLKEAELSELRDQLASTQNELEETRKRNAEAIETLTREMNEVRQQNEGMERTRIGYEKVIEEFDGRVAFLESDKTKLENSKRQLESDLTAARVRMTELESGFEETRAAKESLERQLATILAKVEKADGETSRIEREKTMLKKQVEMLREELEDERETREGLENSKRRLEAELISLQSQLDESEDIKTDLQRQISAKTADFEELKARYDKETNERVAELEAVKRKHDAEIHEWTTKHTEVQTSYANVEKSKARLTAEIEDLRVEIEREQSVAHAADKMAKQIEAQMANFKTQLETERTQRELAESNLRKLQSNAETLALELEEKTEQISNLQRSKNDLEKELQTLIDEFGEGGKNSHELGKMKRRLEARIQELESALEEQTTSLRAAEELRRKVEEEAAQARVRLEEDFLARESHLKETNLVLLSEINGLGEQVEREQAAREELTRLNRKLQEDLQEVHTYNNGPASRGDDEGKAKKKAEVTLRELQARVEAEERAKKNYEEKAIRHEKRSHDLESDLERLEMQLEEAEKAKKAAEQRVQELENQLEGGDGSRESLLAAKTRLERENARLQEELDEAMDIRDFEKSRREGGSSSDYFKKEIKAEMDEKIEKLEESRRALLAAQRIAQQDLDDRTKQIHSLELQKKSLLAEVEELKGQIEEQVLVRNQEAAARRRLAAEMQDLQIRLDAESVKAAELQETLNLYKNKSGGALTKLETAELARMKSEKAEAQLRLQMKELEEELLEERDRSKEADERIRLLEKQVRDLEGRMEDDELELEELGKSRHQLQEELKQERVRYKKDVEELEQSLDATRRKYQKELKQLASEVEMEKSNAMALKEANKDMTGEIEELNQRLEDELRNSVSWRKERERLEFKVQDLSSAYLEAQQQQDELQGQVVGLLAQVRDLRNDLDDAESQRVLLEKTKRSLEQQLEELGERYQDISHTKQAADRNRTGLDQRVAELQEELEASQDAATLTAERLRRVEIISLEAQADLAKEQEKNSQLAREKLALEKQVNELNLHVTELETREISPSPRGDRRLSARLEELNAQLENEAHERLESARQARRNERTIRDLQFQLAELGKARTRHEEELGRAEQKVKTMRQSIDELVFSESNALLGQRRLQRELEEANDRAARLEREVDRLKGRSDRGSTVYSPSPSLSPSMKD